MFIVISIIVALGALGWWFNRTARFLMWLGSAF